MRRYAFICLSLVASLGRPNVLALSIIQNALDNWTQGRTDNNAVGPKIDETASSTGRNSKSTCTEECLKQPFSDEHSCSRGCRFQIITQLLLENSIKFEKFNSKSDTCQSMCREAYAKSGFELNSCQIGCSSYNPIEHKMKSAVIADFSWKWFINGPKSAYMDRSVTVQVPDDVSNELSLRSRITGVEKLRLPDLILKTVPNVAQEKPTSICGSGTVSGVPYCFVWSFLLLVTLLGLWSCLSLDEQVVASSSSSSSQLHNNQQYYRHDPSDVDGDDVKKLLIFKDGHRCSSIIGLDDDLLDYDVDYLTSPPLLKLPPPPPYSQTA